MSFIIDKQTLNDLEIPGRKGKRAVQSLFNVTKTKGGAEQMEDLFLYPLVSATAISKRIELFKFFYEKNIAFPFNVQNLDLADQYLRNTDERTLLNNPDRSIIQRVKKLIQLDSQKELLVFGIKALLNIRNEIEGFIAKISDVPELFLEAYVELKTASDIIPAASSLKSWQLSELDQIFRFEKREKLRKLLNAIYSLDVNITVANVARTSSFTFPKIKMDETPLLEITGLKHPLLQRAIANDISATADKNLIFLTGVNMAGKSTFMKAFGIAVYLAHLGLPVPASRMTFSVFDGLLTTINLSDNISSGHSHFYAEVVRIRMMAEFINKGKRLVIIVDELFRGTNVKDAHDATVAISAALAKKNTSVYLISTHIIEAADKLQQTSAISFVCLPAKMADDKPYYTYELQKGISNERHGMLIVKNEGILDLLNKN